MIWFNSRAKGSIAIEAFQNSSRLIEPEKKGDPEKKGYAVLVTIERAEDLSGQPLPDPPPSSP